MPYPNDRRKNGPEGEEVLSPQYLAMLMACGGEVRAGDRAATPQTDANRPYGRRAGDAIQPDVRTTSKRSP